MYNWFQSPARFLGAWSQPHLTAVPRSISNLLQRFINNSFQPLLNFHFFSTLAKSSEITLQFVVLCKLSRKNYLFLLLKLYMLSSTCLYSLWVRILWAIWTNSQKNKYENNTKLMGHKKASVQILLWSITFKTTSVFNSTAWTRPRALGLCLSCITHTCSSEAERVLPWGAMGAGAGTARLGWPCNSICRLPSFCSQSIWRKQTALLLTLPDPVVVIGRQPPIVSQLS